MTMNGIKRLGRVAALSAIFAASAMPALAQQSGAPPAHSQNYASVARDVGTLADIGNQISMTQHTAAITNQAVDPEAMRDLRAALKQSADEVGPKIVLTSGLTGTEVQSLIDQFKKSTGSLPDYLAKVNGKGKMVGVCQEYLVTPDGVYDKAHAEDVANCVASKQVAAPTEDATAAQPVAPAPVAAQPVAAQPVKTEPPVPAQTAGNNAPETQLPFGLTPVELGGGAAGIVVLGAGALLLTRRKKKSDAPAQESSAATAPPPPGPTDESKIDVLKKPASAPADQRDDTGPSKKAGRFEI
jgi:hypothetical protein